MKAFSVMFNVLRIIVIIAIILSISTLVGAVAGLIYAPAGPVMSFATGCYLGYKFTEPLMGK